MGPIQLVPPGLMGLLQLKQLGKLPGELSETVQPVIELRDWYMTARRFGTPALFPGAPPTVTATAAGALTFVPAAGGTATVPNNEYWYVEEFNAQWISTAAASYIRYSPLLLGAVADQLVLGPDFNDVVTARQRTGNARAERGFWAFPGDSFGLRVHDIITGSAETITLFLRATRLPA